VSEPALASNPIAGRRRAVVAGLLTLNAAALAFAGWSIWASIGEPRSTGSSTFMPTDHPGIRLPRTVPADAAQVKQDAEVIGVTVAGQARAYLVSSFDPMPGSRHEVHVVNDVIAGVPVSVTHCVRTGCTKVYTAAPSSEPLDIGVGGWAGDDHPGLLLTVGSVRYRQDTGQPLTEGASAFPYAEGKFIHTTWEQWRKHHPKSDLYRGSHDPFDTSS